MGEKEMRYRVAFPWYGGKNIHLGWLLPLLPPAHHTVETHGGGASVTLNRIPSPLETYNDIDGDVVNFFRVLRDHGPELIEEITLTPHARDEFYLALQPQDRDPIEQARLFYVRARQVRGGLVQAATPSHWAYCIQSTRRGMSGSTSKWVAGSDKLWDVVIRLRRVQIENDDAIKIIERYDSPDTLFYCDPPYPHESRTETQVYKNEMSDEDHTELADVLMGVVGKVGISGYDSPLMRTLYSKWNKSMAPSKRLPSGNADTRKREVLWTNYDALDVRLWNQATL